MNSKPLYARIDLHCHSWASDKPALWIMQRIGCPESFTAPEHVREIAMMRGMDFVTITDHDTIAGVKEIEHYDNVITGCEVTTYFPNNVKVHVICLGLTHEQYEEIEKIRSDIYEFVRYINDRKILHFLAHPLHKVNDRLTWDHFEKLLLLFKRMEILNGSRFKRMNWIVNQIVTNLSKDDILRLADKHGIEPVGERPWEKFTVGGTDDHSGLFLGTCYTEVEVREVTREALLQGLWEGKTRACGVSEGFLPLAHQVNSIAFQYYRSKLSPESGELFYVLNRIFERNRPEKISPGFKIRKAFKNVTKLFYRPKENLNLIDEIRDVIRDNVALKSLFHGGMMTSEEFNANVFNLTSDVLDEMIVRVCEKPKLTHYFLLFAPILVTSYFMVARNIHAERDLIRKGEEWCGIKRKPRVAWFTDSLVNMDGVSKTCKMFLSAAQSRDCELELLTCHRDDLSGMQGVKNFTPIKEFPTPGYEKVSLFVPSILKVLKYVEDQEFDAIVLSTPGPVGLMGLLSGKLLRLPVHGIYHTDIPRIALQVSGDPMFGELAYTLTRLFYKYVDRVFCPSKWYANDVLNLGLEPEKIDFLERWVDTGFFSPTHRRENYWKRKEVCNLLYVGRISKDKNVDVLIELYQHLAPRYDNFALQIVGDGPYFDEFKAKTSSYSRLIMAGAKFKEDLAAAYASSDVFVYPGLLDTFGNVVVEAQSSGLPCVVMNEGGPQELIVHGETGFVTNSSKQFIQTVENLLNDIPLRQRLSKNAAAYAGERFAEERIFTNFWQTITTYGLNGIEHKNEFPFHFEQGEGKVVPLKG